MKILLMILMSFTVSIRSEIPDWTPIGSPLITAYPCGRKDIVTWFDPSLPAREKNRYYVYIHKILPQNSRLRVVFDTEVTVTINFRTDTKKYVRVELDKGEQFLYRFYQEFKGMGFIVKGAVPGVIPYFKSIAINNEELCYRPYVDYLEAYVDETLTSGPQENCGVRKVRLRKKFPYPNAARPGEWPWHSAIYRFDDSVSKYICGGTLISKTFVLTAAHCASLRGVPLSPEVLTVFLGRYKLKRRSIGAQKKEVQRIILHERFEHRFLYSDIALLKLKSEATFTKYVQPACLWYSKAIEKLPNDTIIGTVVGWGLNSSDVFTYRLKHVKMPMVSETTCVYSNEAYADIVVDDSKFCAGFRNGTSVCNGDSGSGFQIFVPDEVQTSSKVISGAWYVRGIVSLTVAKPDRPVCDPTQYVVFTDIETYRVWIDAYIQDEDY
ncbi:chymotrypsin-like elastase family member 2A [Melitaea cinxia]|uniref:chymotrypsin-like elastase family member 2A n=1 Tax=Melitaea cinxia TaxID=113334 RepID=UPI001E272A39|nr:chymotrypsin-like elastase family member 2A [Melitaea cinxia]